MLLRIEVVISTMLRRHESFTLVVNNRDWNARRGILTCDMPGGVVPPRPHRAGGHIERERPLQRSKSDMAFPSSELVTALGA